ncbi:unnamed protein product [Peniophora sp. CBMAI 1063]|nr:unnamed protein product [Peniophora sp. CBMAI 1063]
MPAPPAEVIDLSELSDDENPPRQGERRGQPLRSHGHSQEPRNPMTTTRPSDARPPAFEPATSPEQSVLSSKQRDKYVLAILEIARLRQKCNEFEKALQKVHVEKDRLCEERKSFQDENQRLRREAGEASTWKTC